MRGRDCGLPHDPRNIIGTSGNVSERLLAQDGQTSTIFDNSQNLAYPSVKFGPALEGTTKRPKKEMRRESQSSSIPVPRFRRGAAAYDHYGGTYSHSIVVDYPRLPMSELHLGKFPDSMELQS